TDHKALEEIRNNPFFNNNRVNRWIERNQEYVFSVSYVKGALMGDADALSRQFEDEVKGQEKMITKQMQGKILKHTSAVEGKEYWRFDDGSQKEILRIEDRETTILKIHRELNHRDVKATYYQLKQKYYWPGMKDMVTKLLKECETCQIANRKNKGGVEFITSSRKGEIFSIDVMEIGEPIRRVLLGIDYYTRFLYAKVLVDTTTKNIISALEEWFTEEEVPEAIISDNAKEFTGIEFREWCNMNEVEHRKVSVESHGSNGRIERAIRTIRESVFKQGNIGIETAIKYAVNKYNVTFHSGLKCTTQEAVRENERDIDLRWENSR
ncbi:hypothetical protein NGRA_3258, partial [Nosema granulosis]